jgi:hypothetical protein
MFYYAIMNIFITLFENVNKSRSSAGGLSLNSYKYDCIDGGLCPVCAAEEFGVEPGEN